MTHTLPQTNADLQEKTHREIDHNQKKQKKQIAKEAKSKYKKSPLTIIHEFKQAALLKIDELEQKACFSGFLAHGEEAKTLLELPLDGITTTSQKSLLIDFQEHLKAFQGELHRAEELELIISSLHRNEKGDAELFLRTYPNKYVFDTTIGKNGEFFFWNGIHWQEDSGKHRYLDMDAIASKYEWASEQIFDYELQDEDSDQSLKKELLSRAKSLRSARRCRSVFEFIAPEVIFKGAWDYCPGYLPCINGIIDLSNGNLLQHDPNRYLRTVCPTGYHPEASSELLEKFVNDIMLGNEAMKDFLGRCLGSALIGDSKEEKIFYFYGEDGRNGKGTLMQALEKTLGKVARTFNSEMLLLQRNPPSSSSASPDLAKLEGVRFAIFSEINRKRQIDSSKVKNLSGRDTIPCRRLFSNVDLEINPTHTLFIQTNFKPEAAADDKALWKRNVLVPFNAAFVEEPRLPHERPLDPKFKDKLFEQREAILAWLIRGCLEYQRHGLQIPDLVKEETEEYRRENDGIGQFLEEMTVAAPEFSAPKKKMQESIKEFCQSNSFNVPSQKEVSKYLREKFQERHTEKGGLWIGVKVIEQRESQWQ